MASMLAMGGTLKHLRDLFHEGTTLGLGDGQLLARYAADRDESAFAALVARHGPMVLATCRAVLRHEPDVEDAFQATFLVLARKAPSVRGGDALGGWLHRVAFRIAVQASAASRRRRRCEAEASARIALRVHQDPLDPDVAGVIHEEVERLPEKHRMAVVLCDLEGLTYEQAAVRLRWTVPTLRCRLAKARQRLRGRLGRRGVSAGAMGIVLGGTAAGARAAVPAAMARAAVVAAMTGTATTGASTLAAVLVRSLAMARLKVAATIVAATAGLVAAGVGAWRPGSSGAGAVPQVVGEMRKRPATAVEAPASSEVIEVRGRVVDPGGRPVAGAAVRGFQPAREDRPAPETVSGPDGRFTLRLRLMGFQRLLRRGGLGYPWVVASAPGFGPGWAPAVRGPGEPEEVAVRLAEDGPPIEGRIVDLEGRPAVGARAAVGRIWFAHEGRLADWLDRAADSGVDGPWRDLGALPAAISANAGPDGRFRLAGIGRDRLAEVLVSGPTIATAEIYVADREGPVIRATDPQSSSAGGPRGTYYPRRFEYAALPTRPIEGSIRDKETGRPLAGFRIEGMVYEEDSLIPAAGVEATTDDRGRYRLAGLPMARVYRLFVEPGRGRPYPNASFVTPEAAPRTGPIAFDMTLRRGVMVRGRVTDKVTGRPVPGYVNAFTFTDNPHVETFPGYGEGNEVYASIGDDGRYEVVALPGRGILAAWSSAGRYLRGAGAGSIKHGFEPIGNSRGGFGTWPSICVIDQHHVLAEIDIDPRAEAVTRDLQVEPGRTLTLHVEDPEGRPLAGTRVRGLSDWAPTFEVAQDSPAVEVIALDPANPRRVTIRHDGRKLMGLVILKGTEAGPMTVRLRRYGIVTGRIVDDEGRPRVGLALTSLGGFGPQAPADEGALPGADVSPGVPVGRDGRFRIEGLIPGLRYGAYAARGRMRLGELFRDLKVGPGEVRDLGDLKVVPPR